MIVVTGCLGFIGFHLSNKLSNNKIVLGIDNYDDYYSIKKKRERYNLLKKHKNFKFVKVDLNNFKELRKLFDKYKVNKVIHLAAQPGVRVSIKNPYNTLKQNLIPFMNILEISRIKKVRKFIYASSSSVYGLTETYPFSENDYKNVPSSVYGATKLSNEIIAQSYSKNFKMKCIGLRFFTVYGPYGRPDMAYYSFLENLKKNKSINIFNKGIMKRDFTYIDDVVEGIINISKKKINNNHLILNIGKGKPDKLMDMVKLIEKNYKKKFKINYTNNIPEGDIKMTFSNTNKAKKLINWKPKTSLKEGMKKFVDWYKSNYDIK